MAALVRGDGLWGTDAPAPGGIAMKFAVGVVFAVWLVVGAVAADQRDYFGHGVPSCDAAGTLAVTIAAGPLNYQGLDPAVSCS